MQNFNARDIVFSPAEIGELSTQTLKGRMTAFRSGGLEAGTPMYSKTLDYKKGANERGFLPALPAELISIIARPGHFKTSFMMRLARERAKHIRRLQDEKRVVVYVTLEQTVEELNSFHLSATAIENKMSITDMAVGDLTDVQWGAIEASNIHRAAEPLWFIGHSILRRSSRPNITVSNMLLALDDIESRGGAGSIKVDSVFVDYLQLMPYNNKESMTVGISENMTALKNVAQGIGAPVFCGVQAKREVDSRDDKIPHMADGEWTANIEKASDKIIALMRPCQYTEQGQDYDGIKIKGYNQLIVACRKQKMGESGFAKWVDFDPKYNTLNDAEIKIHQLN